MTATPFPLGTFVFNPDSTDPAAEAWFENQVGVFSAAMGAKPQFMDTFTNYNADWSQWVSGMTAMARSWAASPVLGGVTPVMTIPMAAASDWGNPDQVFKDIVAGKHDDVFTGLVNSWKAVGYTTIDARIGYEMNGAFVPWFMGNDPATVADWVAAFQHIADLVHAVPGITVKTVWNPVASNWTAQPTASAYPGDQYVDVIGVDVYGTVYPVQLYDWGKNDGTVDQTLQQWFADPVNREHYWTNPNATQWSPNGYDPSQWSLKQALAFAAAHNKPLGLAETGAGGDGTSTGPVDDPEFPKWLAGQLSQPGAPQIAFVNIWDVNPGDGDWEFTNGSKPLELAAWQKYFGAPQTGGASHALPTPPSSGSGPDTLTLAISEDTYQGDAQFTVSLDGVQLGGVLTAQAWHSSGQDQSFVFKGDWGAARQHVVTVSFLNDAWGGTSALDRNLYIDAVTFNGATQKTSIEQDTTGSRTLSVGTATASISFVDSANARFSTTITPANTTEFGNWSTGLNNNIYQWTPSGNVIAIGAATFNEVQVATLADSSGQSFLLNNFNEVNATLSGGPGAAGGTATLEVDNAMRGSITLGAGNYTAVVNVLSAYADPSANTFHVSMGDGDDSLTLHGNAYCTVANVTAGSGTDRMTFIDVSHVSVTGGSGAATVALGNGTGTVVAGSGRLDVTGGASADTYIAHAGAGLLTIENFSVGKGDVLQLDKSLQASLVERQQAAGVLLSFGGDDTHGVLLHGLTTLSPSSITWA